MSADSNMLRPASRQTSTSRVASAKSLWPHALKNSLPPPKVPVPRLSTGTLKPEPPSCLNSIAVTPLFQSPRPAGRAKYRLQEKFIAHHRAEGAKVDESRQTG